MLEEEKPELYLGHCFGRHGECGKDYEGEADDWGTEAWEHGIKFLNLGSEVALALIKNQEKLEKSEEYKQPIDFYADRYIHCFLNNIFDPFKEISFYLNQAIQRISNHRIGRLVKQEELENLIIQIEDLIFEALKISK